MAGTGPPAARPARSPASRRTTSSWPARTRTSSRPCQRQFAEVRATATGAVLAAVTPPRPYGTFSAAAAGDGRTFVLVANKWKVVRANGGTFAEATATKFFLLRLGAGGRTRQLTPLPIPASRRGRRYRDSRSPRTAASSPWPCAAASIGGPGPAIQVFDLATGAKRVWTWPGGGPITNNAGGNGQVLSWTADGRTLAFQQWVGGTIINVRLLDTTTPGGSLQVGQQAAAAVAGRRGNLALRAREDQQRHRRLQRHHHRRRQRRSSLLPRTRPSTR